MDEKDLKTSPKQRFFIILIAVLMLGSMVAGYIMMVLNGGKSSSGSTGDDTSEVDEAKVAEYEEAYNKVQEKFTEETKSDFEELKSYKSEIVAYNETSANQSGVKSKDLKEGSGREITEGDSDYLAYYIGWCADGEVFDSSFDDYESPTGLKGVLDLSSNSLIEGWYAAMVGAKIGGVRRITIPGELAYADSMEICGGYDKPIRFLVMTRENGGSLKKLSDELETAYMRWQYASYGMDYDSMSAE